MPDKEGSDDEKTTKGVVKKKQKQMLNQEYIPEEEYDHYRDRIAMAGGDHRSKETRERSNTPTGKQPKGKTVYQKQAEKKYGKGKSALDMVKADITAKYGKGAIMDVKKKSKKKSKKKANEELDLTKIAEAFGGYVIEQDIPDPWNDKSETPEKKKKAKKQAQKDIGTEPETDAKEDEFATGTQTSKPVVKKTQAKNYKQKTTGKNITGGQGIKLNPFSGTVNPKTGKVEERPVKIIRKGSTARKQAQRTAAVPKQSTAQQLSDPKSTGEFQKALAATGETMGSEGMKSDAEKIIKRQGRKAGREVEGGGKKTGGLKKGNLKFSGDKSYQQLKMDMKSKELTAADKYQQRMQQAFDTGSGAPRFTDLPSVQPLPAAPKGTKKGQPQKPRPRAQKPPEGTYSRVGGQREVIGKVDTKVTGGEYGKLRSGQTADQSKLNQALTGRDAEGNPIPSDQRKELMKQSRGTIDSDAVKNVSKNLTKGAMPRKDTIQTSGEDDKFQTGRDQESITMKPKPESPNVTINTPPKNPLDDLKDPKKQKELINKGARAISSTTTRGLEAQSDSMVGTMGGLITKTAFPTVAGIEAGASMARGDKMGAFLSAMQSAGGGLGFGFGVLNALRMRSPGYKVPQVKATQYDPKSGSGKLARKDQIGPDKAAAEREGIFQAGGTSLSRILQNARRSTAGRVAGDAQKQRAIRVSAKQ